MAVCWLSARACSLLRSSLPEDRPCDCAAAAREYILLLGQLEDQMGVTNRLRWAAVFALSCALPAIAHHSFSAEFDASKTVTLRGIISKVDCVNPHSWIYLDVKGGTDGHTKHRGPPVP